MNFLVKTALTLLISFSVISIFSVPQCAKKMQTKCVQFIPKDQKARAELQTLVCGDNQLSENQNLALKNLGLFHLFVISAGQISWWRQFLGLFFKSELLLYFSFSFLTLFTGFQAPLVRALGAVSIQNLIPQSKSLHKEQQILITGLFCFFILPSSQTLSLQLSWLCALLLRDEEITLKSLLKLQISFFAMSWILFHGQPLAGWAILANLFFAPIFSLLIYPLSVLVYLLSSLFHWQMIWYLKLWEQIWVFLNFYVSENLMAPKIDFAQTQKKAWMLLFAFHAFYHFRNVLGQKIT